MQGLPEIYFLATKPAYQVRFIFDTSMSVYTRIFGALQINNDHKNRYKLIRNSV